MVLILVETRQRERYFVVVCVQEHQQRVARDLAAALIDFFDGVAGEQHAEAARELRVPRGIVHFLAVGRQPCNVLDAANTATLEIFAATQHGL